MIKAVELQSNDRVHDLGCGYGVVGILCAKQLGVERVLLSDIEPIAVEAARANGFTNGLDLRVVQSDGYNEIDETGFTQILLNPPYHVDFSVPKRLIEKAFNRLAITGQLHLVVKRRKWYENKLRSVFGNATARNVEDYVVLSAVKNSWSFARSV